MPTLIELFVLLFANDIALLSLSPGGLQAQLDSLKECCDRIKLTVNKDKTKIRVFGKGGITGRREHCFFEGQELEIVNSYCYLGFTFTTKLSLKEGTAQLVAKGKKA